MFSKALIALYENAAQTSPGQFAEEAIRIVGQFITFDGAVLGSGVVDSSIPGNLLIGWGRVHQRDKTLLQEYGAVSAYDPITKSFVDGLAAPVIFAPQEYYRAHHVPELHQLTRRHDIKSMLLYGRAPATTHNARWLALFRGRGWGFSHVDSALIEALWPHIGRAIEINMYCSLKEREPQHLQSGSAFINSHGFPEVAEPSFVRLLQLEWPDHDEAGLPLPVISALVRNRVFHGKQINIFAVHYADYMICTAQRLKHVVSLGSSEWQVAHYFANGMTNKEIASKTGTSPHTVRMQLKTVYRKLGVHRKVDLARAIMTIR